MSNELLILCWLGADASDQNLAKLAEALGIRARLLVLEPLHPTKQISRWLCAAGETCVAASARTLGGLLPCLLCAETGKACDGRGLGDATHLFVYGFELDDLHQRVLRYLTDGGLIRVTPLCGDGLRYSVPRQTRDFCRQFAGLTFGAADRTNDLIFLRGKPSARLRELITIGGMPFMVHLERQKQHLVLAATRQIVDIDCPLGLEKSALKWFSRLLPAMIFLRRAFGEACWHNEHPAACHVLDDPPLWPTYGPLNFEQLARSMERASFTTSLAFIPWNYRRSAPEMVRLFKRYPQLYSLCVHGCDHTRNEFGTTDDRVLARKVRRADTRMRFHLRATGLSFDKIMVFPHGVFSTRALKALNSCKFLAAVNTELRPVDDTQWRPVLRDLLAPAVVGDWEFPLFLRRPFDAIGDIAFDLFVGHPAFVVTHPEDFRSGYDRLEETARLMNALEPKLIWGSLKAACAATYWERALPDGSRQVLACTNYLHMKNTTSETLRYEVYALMNRTRCIGTPILDGATIRPFPREQGLTTILTLAPGRAKLIPIDGDDHTPFGGLENAPLPQKVGAFVRRRLCDVRNTILRQSPLFRRLEGALRPPSGRVQPRSFPPDRQIGASIR